MQLSIKQLYLTVSCHYRKNGKRTYKALGIEILSSHTRILTVTYMLLLSTGTVSHAASFDCSKAITETEKAICADPRLTAIDNLLNRIWIEAGSATQDYRSEQLQWISERDKCFSNSACIEEAYISRLYEEPFNFDPIYNFYISELYDFSSKRLGNYLFLESFGGAYNTTIWVYDIFEDSVEPVIWKHVLWDEALSTCDIKLLDGREMNLYEDYSGLGWLNFTNQWYAEKDIPFGEFSVTNKWVGHGDQSSEVIYRLVGGIFEPNRGFVDNCSDKNQKMIPVYFK